MSNIQLRCPDCDIEMLDSGDTFICPLCGKHGAGGEGASDQVGSYDDLDFWERSSLRPVTVQTHIAGSPKSKVTARLIGKGLIYDKPVRVGKLHLYEITPHGTAIIEGDRKRRREQMQNTKVTFSGWEKL